MADKIDEANRSTVSDTKVHDNGASKSDSKKPLIMRVRVYSPFKTFFDDEAVSLSGENGSGPFDILPHHHNFISLLTEGELSIKTHNGTVQIRISGGIMHVKADQIVVFLNV